MRIFFQSPLPCGFGGGSLESARNSKGYKNSLNLSENSKENSQKPLNSCHTKRCEYLIITQSLSY
ncbi:hypothetical protein [Campylobacter troglodytis]|uniref:hypothetical protein n=1 Tax=Campylobacter troglodytis TaxID=654363 RepID=UPI0011586A0A|nr:hypothetical protein [Campylobacter troglodytis]TQR57321.1 hypothetical protein DMC01_08600 [Campylobacter troglodytis]